MVQYLNSGVLLMEANIECQVILAAFPDYGTEKSLCCHLIVNCVGVPDYGAENTLDVKNFIETDSAIRWRKRTACDVGERPEEACC